MFATNAVGRESVVAGYLKLDYSCYSRAVLDQMRRYGALGATEFDQVSNGMILTAFFHTVDASFRQLIQESR